MKVLSLFDGIGCARIALDELNIPVEKYYSSEIDEYAITVLKNNWDDIIHLGGVESVKNIPDKIDLLIGGSPCQDLSIAKNNRQGLKGSRSGLFWEYVRILKEVKPKYFILENVASMPAKDKDIITKALGVDPVMIDAKLVSAQQRKRLFWVGKRKNGTYKKVNIPQPKDRKIYLKDILQSGEEVKEKAYYLTKSQKDFINDFIKRHQGNFVFKDKPIRVATIGKGGQGDRICSIHGKTVCLSAKGGGRGAKTGLYLITGASLRTFPRKKINSKKRNKRLEIRKDRKANAITRASTDSMVVLKDYFRPLTPIECERLQCVPDDYTFVPHPKFKNKPMSKTKRKEMLGNAFNVEIIKHIIKYL